MHSYLQYSSTASAASTVSQIEKLESVHRYVNTQFFYATDETLYGKSDYWASPQEFYAKGAGDCEDFALYKAYLLEKEGIKVALAYFYKQGQAHIALLAEIEGSIYLSDIDATLKKITLTEIKHRKMLVAHKEVFLKKYS